MGYTISEMAKILGISPSALRYYDKEGLLPYVERTKGGSRIFTDRDYEALMVIDCLKKSGLSIKEIKAFIELSQKGDISIGERLELFCKRREMIQRQMEEARAALALLDYKCWYYETAQAAGTEDIVRRMPIEEVPSVHRKARKMLEIGHRKDGLL